MRYAWLLLLALATAVAAQSGPSVSLTWEAPPLTTGQSITGYEVARCALPPGQVVCTCLPQPVPGATTATLRYDDSTVVPGQTYCYTVATLANVNGQAATSGPSNTLLITVGGLPPPGVPGALRADLLLPRTLLVATADVQETLAAPAQAARVLDGAPGTFWHSQYTPTLPPLPHWLRLDLHGGLWWTGGLVVWPRQDTSANGMIKDYRVEGSEDGTTWTVLASGTWPASRQPQTVRWAPFLTQGLRLVALSNQQQQCCWASLAEIALIGATQP